MTIVVNAIARLLIRRVSRQAAPQLALSSPRKRGPMFESRKMGPRFRGDDDGAYARSRGDDSGPHTRSRRDDEPRVQRGNGGRSRQWSFHARRACSAAMAALTAMAAVGTA